MSTFLRGSANENAPPNNYVINTASALVLRLSSHMYVHMVVHYVITCLCQWCHWCYCSPFHNVNVLGNKLNCLYALWPRPTYVCTHMWEWILNNNGTRFIVSFQPLDWGRLPSIYKYIKLQLTYSPLILLPQNKHWLHWDFLSVKNETYIRVYTNRW